MIVANIEDTEKSIKAVVEKYDNGIFNVKIFCRRNDGEYFYTGNGKFFHRGADALDYAFNITSGLQD